LIGWLTVVFVVQVKTGFRFFSSMITRNPRLILILFSRGWGFFSLHGTVPPEYVLLSGPVAGVINRPYWSLSELPH
jgi:hypothetical protein